MLTRTILLFCRAGQNSGLAVDDFEKSFFVEKIRQNKYPDIFLLHLNSKKSQKLSFGSFPMHLQKFGRLLG
jgi:cellobiose-specific phosphotransferase system component IIB